MNNSAAKHAVCALCGNPLIKSATVSLAVARMSGEGAMVFVAHPECFEKVAAPQFARAISAQPQNL